MSDRWLALLSIAFVWGAGYAVARAIVPGDSDRRLSIQAGYGYFVGWLVTAGVLWLAAAWHVPVRMAVAITAVVLAGAGALAWTRWRSDGRPDTGFRAWWGAGKWPLRLAFCVFLSLVSLHVLMYGVEAWYRPLYAWDAWMHWAPKARVWTELNEFAQFGPRDIAAAANSAVYTIRNWDYPTFIPLVQTWISVPVGRWNDIVVGLPWPGALVALLLAVYGQVREMGFSPLAGVVAAWMLASLPIVGVHTALAGYADLWMAAIYGLAVAAALKWVRDGDSGQLVFAIVFTLACPWVKVPGLAWLLTLLPVFLVRLVSPARLVATCGAILVLVSLAMVLSGGDLTVPGVGRFVLNARHVGMPVLGYYTWGWQGVGKALASQMFLWPDWHLGAWLVVSSLAIFGVTGGESRKDLAPWLLASGAVGFPLLVFLFTERSAGVVHAQTTYRAFLHAAPALVFASMALAAGRLRRPQ